MICKDCGNKESEVKGLCKTCYYIEWKKKNRDNFNEYHRKYVKERCDKDNKFKAKKRKEKKDWARNNPEKVKAYSKFYYEKIKTTGFVHNTNNSQRDKSSKKLIPFENLADNHNVKIAKRGETNGK